MKKILFSLSIICCLTEFACTKDNDKNDVTGDSLTLKMNETAVVPNSNNTLKIVFKDVVDNRCPMSMCEVCYGSRADVQLSPYPTDEPINKEDYSATIKVTKL